MLTKALDDVERIEKSKLYKINMDIAAQRHRSGDKCEVCLGGSQLIGKLPRGAFELWFDDDRLSDNLSNKLCALDCLRTGDVGKAYSVVKYGSGVGWVSHSLDREVVDYHLNPELWKAQMRVLAVELKQANL